MVNMNTNSVYVYAVAYDKETSSLVPKPTIMIVTTASMKSNNIVNVIYVFLKYLNPIYLTTISMLHTTSLKGINI